MHCYEIFGWHLHQMLELVGIYNLLISTKHEYVTNIPLIQVLNLVTTLSVQDTDQVSKCGFPNTEFKFMQEINDKHPEEI